MTVSPMARWSGGRSWTAAPTSGGTWRKSSGALASMAAGFQWLPSVSDCSQCGKHGLFPTMMALITSDCARIRFLRLPACPAAEVHGDPEGDPHPAGREAAGPAGQVRNQRDVDAGRLDRVASSLWLRRWQKEDRLAKVVAAKAACNGINHECGHPTTWTLFQNMTLITSNCGATRWT